MKKNKIRSGCLATPEAFVGRHKMYVYYDPFVGEFWMSENTPEDMPPMAMSPRSRAKYIVTLQPINDTEAQRQLAEVEAFHRKWGDYPALTIH